MGSASVVRALGADDKMTLLLSIGTNPMVIAGLAVYFARALFGCSCSPAST